MNFYTVIDLNADETYAQLLGKDSICAISADEFKQLNGVYKEVIARKMKVGDNWTFDGASESLSITRVEACCSCHKVLLVKELEGAVAVAKERGNNELYCVECVPSGC